MCGTIASSLGFLFADSASLDAKLDVAAVLCVLGFAGYFAEAAGRQGTGTDLSPGRAVIPGGFASPKGAGGGGVSAALRQRAFYAMLAQGEHDHLPTTVLTGLRFFHTERRCACSALLLRGGQPCRGAILPPQLQPDLRGVDAGPRAALLRQQRGEELALLAEDQDDGVRAATDRVDDRLLLHRVYVRRHPAGDCGAALALHVLWRDVPAVGGGGGPPGAGTRLGIVVADRHEICNSAELLRRPSSVR